MTGQKTTIEFNDKIVRQFMLASIIWGAVGMLVGVLIATQLNFFQANFGTAWLTFGRLRPLHTNAVIFAFVGNMMFAGIYHSTQRLVKARLASDFLSQLHFWGWQLIIVAAAITLPLGLTRGKEYAELIWPINLAVAFIWVVFAVNFFWTLARRNEKSLYVALWFYRWDRRAYQGRHLVWSPHPRPESRENACHREGRPDSRECYRSRSW